MNKIKILYTIPNFDTAGSQYVVKSLYAGLDKTIFDPYIGVESKLDLIPNIVPEERRILMPSLKDGYKQVLSLRNLLKTHKIALLHSWDYRSLSKEAIGCRLAGVKYLFTKKNNSWSKRWFLKSLLAHHIAYDNPLMKERFFNSALLKSKISFIPHGVDTQLFYPKPKPDKPTFDLCFIGNINHNKNQAFIIKALQSLPDQVHLFLYGKEEPVYTEALNLFINEQNLANRVHFMGYLENEMIPKVLNSHHVFVMASINEGLPLSIIEALACGLPVLSSDSGGGSRYLLEKTGGGSLFSISTTQELVNQVLHLMNDSKSYKEMSDNAHKNAHLYFNLQTEIELYKPLYLKLANANL
jgi:glycosyltransferase involved in cell wall biosynthesis